MMFQWITSAQVSVRSTKTCKASFLDLFFFPSEAEQRPGAKRWWLESPMCGALLRLHATVCNHKSSSVGTVGLKLSSKSRADRHEPNIQEMVTETIIYCVKVVGFTSSCCYCCQLLLPFPFSVNSADPQ